ncbi:MAG: alanine racemase [Deltaproteobacteria bacterium]|nr:alanine racemase [Deltaproteobacteria bacterium]
MPNTIKIRLSALAHNLNQVRRLIGPKPRIMGIVKSDAYGHGLIQVSRSLEKNGIDALGVTFLHEALELRQNGVRVPVIILCGIRSREEADLVVKEDITPMIFDMSSAEWLSRSAVREAKRVPIHLKLDTGMGRLGLPHVEAPAFLRRLMELEGLYVEGLASHLSSADSPESDFTINQIRRFEAAVDMGRSMGLELPLNHLANSAGIMAHPDSHFDMVRPGIMLYGGLPSPEFSCPVPLKPVMEFRGRVLQVRDLPDRTPVSYGRTYYTQGPQRLAITSAGYADGLHRRISNKGKALIAGEKVDMVGAVCMNMILCDITSLQTEVRPGDEVIYIGDSDKGAIFGDDVARWAETISYEVFCSIGQKVTKEYIE